VVLIRGGMVRFSHDCKTAKWAVSRKRRSLWMFYLFYRALFYVMANINVLEYDVCHCFHLFSLLSIVNVICTDFLPTKTVNKGA
jgi:hypothetical protein